MPRPRRIQAPGAYYHVLNRGVEKRPIVFDDRDRKTFLQLLGETVREYQLRAFAYCLMDNHYHLFLQILQANLNRAMQSFQGQYAHYVNLRYERTGSLFQDRYKSRLVDADLYALALARYIHRNPLEAGIVGALEQYLWSSYACYAGALPKWEWLDTGWLLSQFDSEPSRALARFKAFHATPQVQMGSDPFGSDPISSIHHKRT